LLFTCFCFPPQEQETPLHCAAWHGYSPVALALCQAGCHTDAKNREGESALLTASARGFVDIVECLVEHGADMEAADKVRGPELYGWSTLLSSHSILLSLSNQFNWLCWQERCNNSIAKASTQTYTIHMDNYCYYELTLSHVLRASSILSDRHPVKSRAGRSIS